MLVALTIVSNNIDIPMPARAITCTGLDFANMPSAPKPTVKILFLRHFPAPERYTPTAPQTSKNLSVISRFWKNFLIAPCFALSSFNFMPPI